jgi:hypothetical protein
MGDAKSDDIASGLARDSSLDLPEGPLGISHSFVLT